MKLSINPTYDEFYTVDQDEICISVTSTELRTGGLSTCSALIMVGQGKHLLAHVDAMSNNRDLEQAIHNNFDLSDPNLRIFIIPGDGGFGTGPELSFNKIEEIIQSLGIDERALSMPIYTDFMKELVLINGTVSVDKKRNRQSEIVEQDGLQYVFVTNALPEQISDLGNGSLKGTFGSGEYATERVYKNARIGPARGGYENLVGVYEARQS